ncbi:MAG: PIN domain-containing protein [Christensenellales bacterium]|jgi:predicted nucleic acid-binding protein
MRVLIDTDVLLDVLCNRPGLAEASQRVWKLCEIGTIEGCVCALSVPNIAYILRKELDPEKVKDVIDKLHLLFTFTDLKATDLIKAADMGFADYEDAVQSACAERIKARFIVTRNIRDHKNSKIPAIPPEELPEKMQ